jgi:PAS domain S-box-containing protein
VKISQYRLAEKGLVLVSVPLIFQIVFVVILALLLHQAQLETGREYHAKLLAVEASETSRLFYDLVRVLILSRFSSTELQTNPDKLSADIRGHLERMKQLGGDNFREREAVRRIILLSEEQLNVVSDLRRLSKEGTDPIQKRGFGDFKQRIFAISSLLVREVENLTTEAREIERTSPQVAERARYMVMLALLGGVVFSISLTVALSLFFSRNVTGRLATLTDNSKRLARGAELTPVLEGSDEIVELDNVFHEMAAALSEAARKERALVDYAQDIICSLDSNRTFLKINPASQRILGHSPAEMVGQPLLEFVSSDDSERTICWLEEVRSAASPKPLESMLRRKDGSIVYTLWTAHWSESDKAFFCVAHDLTARKELDLRKQELMAMVTHDLRSPLTAIQGCLAMLPLGKLGEITERGLKLSGMAWRASERMLALINDLLDLEKLEAGQMQMEFQEISIDQVIQRSAEGFENMADNQNVKLKTSQTGLAAYGDEHRLVQVLVNLIGNALKYSPDGGTISIDAVSIESFVEVQVTDQGRGIPAHLLDAVFERFKQVEIADAKKKKGTGLGLAICKAIIEQHNGKIGVTSEEGKGSTFWLRIPSSDKVLAA